MRLLKAIHALSLPLLALSLAACGGDQATPTPNAGGGGGPGGGGPGGRGGRGFAPLQVTPVEIAVVARTTIANTSLVTGLLEPIQTVSVNAQLAGALLEVRVEEGTRVSEGQVLATLDARELEAQVRAAEAAQVFAKSTADRSAELFKQQIVTAAEFERDRSALAAADASLAQLRTRLGFSMIKAPISGVVTARFVRGGDIVSNNTRLFTVADLSTLVVRLPVSELEVAQLRTGAEVTLTVDALGGAPYKGRIRRIFPAADSVSRLVPVEVALTGAATSQLRPGYTVRANLKLDSREDALVVPTRAVLGATGARSVFVVRNGQAERRPVRVGDDIDGHLEVFSGLALGDTVIVAGNSLVREGGKVRIVDPLSPDAPSRNAGPGSGGLAPGATIPAQTPADSVRADSLRLAGARAVQ
jgi:membrane fusion protein, multidrug efflux system